jgi:hypothetical protein
VATFTLPHPTACMDSFGGVEVAMKLGQVLVMSLAIIVAGALIGGSNLLLARYQYVMNPNTDSLFRVDKFNGEVERFDKQRGWISVRSP